MRRVTLTDTLVRSLQPAPTGKRIEIADVLIPQFRVRVTDKGAKSYVLYRRWPGSKTPARRAIGNADVMKLTKAREKAREWLGQVVDEIDPRTARREAELAEQKLNEHLFGTVAEEWLNSSEVTGQRKCKEVQSDVRREFIGRWAKRPVSSITTQEISIVIRDKAKKTPAQARNLLSYIKRLYSWAIDQYAYGIETSPATVLSAKRLCGKKTKRDRNFDNDELRLFWRATAATPYPYGPLLRMLMLTGQREAEVGEARWREFDMAARRWTIPASRMKMKKPHIVPLSAEVIALLKGLPRHNKGDHLFSTSAGVKPVNGYGSAKTRFDILMGETPHWVFHDIRRTVRTNLSKLNIAAIVCEAMIAHAKPGILGVYDQHDYLEEKVAGFELWAKALRKIVGAK